MMAASLDKLPPELLSSICETIYHSHKPSLNSLSLVNKTCSLSASKFIFRDILFSYGNLQHEQFVSDCEKWTSLLSRRACLKSVRNLRVYSAYNRSPSQPDRDTLLQYAEWGIDSPDLFAMHYQILHTWMDVAFIPLAELIQRLPYLTTLHWEVIEQLPECILQTIVRQRSDLRLDMPDWTLHCPSLGPSALFPRHALVTCPKLKSITAETYDLEGFDRHVLLQTLSSANPHIEELRIVKCEELSHCSTLNAPREETSGRVVRFGNSSQARLKVFSIDGIDHIEKSELEDWFHAADMSFLQRLELRSGLKGTEVWDTTMRSQLFPDLKHLLLGFEFDCSSEEYDAAMKWLLDLHTIHNTRLRSLSLYIHVSTDTLFDILKPHGRTLRSLNIDPWTNCVAVKPIFADAIRQLANICPLLEQLTIPVMRGVEAAHPGYEARQYAALGHFPNLTHLHVILDISAWGGLPERKVMPQSDLLGGAGFGSREYNYSRVLHFTPITYGHVRHAFRYGATDDKLARQIWKIITSQKIGCPLYELWIVPRGTMEIVHGFRPDDHPEFASHFVDLYAILRELSRSYKIRPHVRDDVEEVVVNEPPGQLPRGYWSGLPKEECDQGETVVHLDGVEMEIFRSIWVKAEGSKSWKDDWESCDLKVPRSLGGAKGT